MYVVSFWRKELVVFQWYCCQIDSVVIDEGIEDPVLGRKKLDWVAESWA